MRVFRLKREAILSALEAAARRLVAERPEVLEVRLFGSLARGDAGPGSDADILIVLSETERPFLERIPDYARALAGAGIGCDVLPYTRTELARLRHAEGSFADTACRESRVLAARESESA